MKAQKLTKEVFDELANGKYLIFRNGELVDTLTMAQFHDDGSRSVFPIKGTFNGIESTGMVIKAMVEDVYREAKGEIVESREGTKAISSRAAKLFKEKVTKL